MTTILMAAVLVLQPVSRGRARGRRCSVLHSVHIRISCLIAGSAGTRRESEKVLFQKNKEGKDECTCLISYRQLNTSSFPLPLIPNFQPVEQIA